VAGEVVNLGFGESISLADMAPLVARKMNRPDAEIVYVGDRPGQVFRHTADATKAQRLVGWRPEVSFEDGLDRTVAWYTANRPWWEKQLWMRDIPILTKTGKRELH
jgi:dTDP-glucose 4,6-dehydratase